MDYLAFVVWEDGHEAFQIDPDDSPQIIADYIVNTMSVLWPSGYPGTITLFKNGPNCPLFVRQLRLGIDFQG